MINIVACDLGYAYIQGKNNNTRIKFDAYIKQIPENEVEDVRSSIENFDTEHILAKYNKKYYVLGKLALKSYPSISKRLIQDRCDDIAIVQYLSTIALLFNEDEVQCNLAIGYPNRARNDKEKSETMFQGFYQIEFLKRNETVNKIIRFENIKSIPQAVSVAFSIDEENRDGSILILDIGHGTLDISVLIEMSVSKEPGARFFNRGCELVYKMLEEKIYNSDIVKRHKIPKLNEKTIQGIIETGKWKINGIEQPEIKTMMVTVLNEYADDIYNSVVANIVNLDSCDMLLGSGGIFRNKEFTQYLANKFKEYGFIFAVSPEPEWSVVEGLFNFAEDYFEVEEDVENTEIIEEA